MALSSIHIIPVKANSEIHNKRLKEYDYVRKELTPTNESWEGESLADARKRINKAYKKTTGQRIQKIATPIREGVVNLNPDTTMEDLHKLRNALYDKFGIKTIQIHIHRDEGHAKAKEWKQNLHAHMVFDWTDERGKTLKLNMHDMTELQDIVSETLKMERGQKSNKKHLSSIAYKVQELEKDLEKMQKQVAEYINITTPENLENYIEKTIFGKKIREDRLQELIHSEKAKASIISSIQEKNQQLQEETRKIVQSYQDKLGQLDKIEEDAEKERRELQKKKNELEASKRDYVAKVQQMASQLQELRKLREEKAELEAVKAKYEKIKKYEGLENSRKYIDESVHVRELYEAKVAKVVMAELAEEKTYRSKEELYSEFSERLKNHGFTEEWDENPFFDILEEEMNIQYRRGRGIGI